MPNTHEEHITYTRNELRDLPYYQQMLSVLMGEEIKYYLDIGANVGEFRNIIVEKIPTIIKSFLIEPEESNFNFLKENVTKKDDCVFFNVAVGYGSNSGQILRSSNVGGHQIEKESGNVEIKELESFNIPIVDLLKMDVEGMEYEIIQESSYLKKVKWMDIEFHQTPDQSNNHFVKSFILENLPTFDIIVYQNDGLNNYGRCLLKNRI